MSRRLLILTAGFGEGHNAAARALAAACDAAHGPGAALVIDAFALAAPRLNAIARRGYLAMINRTPHTWRRLYAWLDRSTRVVPRCFALLHRETKLLARLIAAESPAAICSVYPIYGFLLERLARSGHRLPLHVNVVTDSISINSLWWRGACQSWYLPNQDSSDVLRRAGIDSTALHVLGFPVTPYFAEHAREFSPPNLAAGAAPRVLYIINSGTQHATETIRLLLAQSDWDITCAVGRDEHLRRQLTHLAAGRSRPAQILGWTDRIPSLLMNHHVVISKAGGATTQEAIAARCPMIVNQIVPGQEEGNYELLRRHGIGALAETPVAVVAALQRAFASRGRIWQQWREALRPLVRPHAARDIVAHVLNHAATTPIKHIPVPLPAPPPLQCQLIDDTLTG
ncbi:MAG: galactosyldiacylglycerol synthase [Opitutaceae bacterium]